MTRVFCVFFWLIISTAPAWADLSFGVVPAKDALVRTKQQAAEFASYLEERLQEPVRLRVFNSESLLHKWLNRYREVDFAILSTAYHDSKRKGEFIPLVNYQPTLTSRLKPCTLVGRRGLSADIQQRLLDVLFVMDTDQRGVELLKKMQLESFSGPDTRVVLHQPTAKKTPQTNIAKTKPAKAPKTTKSISKKPVPAPQVSSIAPAKIVEQEISEPVPTTVPTPAAPSVAKPEPAPLAQQATSPSAESILTEAPQPTAKIKKAAELPDGDKAPYSRKAQQVQPTPETDAGAGRKYLIAIAAVLLVGAGIKLFLIYQRRPRQRPAIPSSQMLMQHDWSELHQEQPAEVAAATSPAPAEQKTEEQPVPTTATATAPAAETASEPDAEPFKVPVDSPESMPQGLPTGQLQLDGNLGPRQIPAMLQLIAASGQSGTLTVTASHNEKHLSFSRGKITTASSRNINNRNQSGFLMNKLGYLLVRQGKINEEQRDQALVMCEGDANLRLGEALLKMGALKRVELQKSLCDQAKMILHSLIVFPEGRFEFTAGDAQIPPEDNLRLSVNDFLKEAAAHQGEWRNIREMIPSLDTVLEFAPGGQEKVSNGRMTVHQKFVLSLVDGQKPIREVCIAATMLDYELYRFLYLMTKANILQRA